MKPLKGLLDVVSDRGDDDNWEITATGHGLSLFERKRIISQTSLSALISSPAPPN